MPLYISFSPYSVFSPGAASHCRGFVGLTCWPSARVSGALSSTSTKVPSPSLLSTAGWRECVTVHPSTACPSAVWTKVSGVQHWVSCCLVQFVHFSHGVECQHCVDEWGVLFDWCSSGAGSVVAQLLPNVVGRLVKLSVFLLDPTDVLESLQDSSVASLTLVMSHLRPMVRDCVSNCLVL